MRTVSAAMTTVLAGTRVRLIPLVTILDATTIRRALWHEDVTFDGNTYTADGGTYGAFRHGTQGTRPRTVLRLQNVDLAWTTTLDADPDALNGTEVNVRAVEHSLLADTDAVILEDEWYISGARLTRTGVEFGLGSPHDALAVQTPRLPLGGRVCWWNYKQGPCTSVSTHKTCGKTLADCAARYPEGSILKFGPVFPFFARAGRGRR